MDEKSIIAEHQIYEYSRTLFESNDINPIEGMAIIGGVLRRIQQVVITAIATEKYQLTHGKDEGKTASDAAEMSKPEIFKNAEYVGNIEEPIVGMDIVSGITEVSDSELCNGREVSDDNT